MGANLVHGRLYSRLAALRLSQILALLRIQTIAMLSVDPAVPHTGTYEGNCNSTITRPRGHLIFTLRIKNSHKFDDNRVDVFICI